MAKKRFSVEQIISHLREAEVFLAQGQTIGQVCRHTGPQHRKPSSREVLIRSSFNGDYDRIRPSLDIESNLKSGIVRGGRSHRAPRSYTEIHGFRYRQGLVRKSYLFRIPPQTLIPRARNSG